MNNPPEGLTSEDILHMSGDDLLDIDYSPFPKFSIISLAVIVLSGKYSVTVDTPTKTSIAITSDI